MLNFLHQGDSPTRERSPIHRGESRRSTGYHSDGHHSNMSSDNEDLSIRSDTTGMNVKSLVLFEILFLWKYVAKVIRCLCL